MRRAALVLWVGWQCLSACALGQQASPTVPPVHLPLPASAQTIDDPGQLRAAAAELSGIARVRRLKGVCQDTHLARIPVGRDSGLWAVQGRIVRAGYVMTPLPEGGTEQLAFTLHGSGRMLVGLLTFGEADTVLAWCQLPKQPPRLSPLR